MTPGTIDQTLAEFPDERNVAVIMLAFLLSIISHSHKLTQAEEQAVRRLIVRLKDQTPTESLPGTKTFTDEASARAFARDRVQERWITHLLGGEDGRPWVVNWWAQ